ncbi:MAG: CoA transferase, partial [Deltaproteobacteria bacterium]
MKHSETTPPSAPAGKAPLAGLRVLDLSRVLAGPFATMHLADMGADVVKIEPPGGDETRSFGPPFVEGADGAESAYFLAVNRGKRSVCMDLKARRDRELTLALAGAADVVVANFRPGVLERLGLGADALVRRHPRLVVCRISGFGPDDPRPGYDNIIQGMSGIPALTGEPDGPPAKCGASIADLVGGHNTVQAILAALLRRECTGRGGVIDVTLLDGMLDMLVYHATGWLGAGVAPVRRGDAHPSVHPLGRYRSADGWISLAVGNDPLFARLCEGLGLSWMADDPRFRTNPARVAHRAALDAEFSAVIATRTSEEWVERLQALGVPCGPVRSVPQALDSAPRVAHPHP